MKPQDISGQLEPVFESLLAQAGMELVDLEYRREAGQWVLRVFIDCETGVGLEECQSASHLLGEYLDAEDPISQAYNLEISSPGLDRVIKKDKDFERFAGARVKVRMTEAVNGQKNFEGVLEGLENGDVLLVGSEERIRLPKTLISRVRLAIDQEDLFKSGDSGKTGKKRS